MAAKISSGKKVQNVFLKYARLTQAIRFLTMAFLVC